MTAFPHVCEDRASSQPVPAPSGPRRGGAEQRALNVNLQVPASAAVPQDVGVLSRREAVTGTAHAVGR